MTNLILAILFGLCTIASALVLIAWFPVLLNGQRGENPKYWTVALGMIVATTGVVILSVNRTSVAITGERLFPLLLMLAGITILVGKTIWLKGAAMERSNKPFYAFAALGAGWIMFCLWWFR